MPPPQSSETSNPTARCRGALTITLWALVGAAIVWPHPSPALPAPLPVPPDPPSAGRLPALERSRAAQASRDSAASRSVRGGRDVGAADRVRVDPVVSRAVERGLDYLARHQNEDGSWTERVGRKVYRSYRGEVHPHVGVTGLAGLAFLSAGILSDQGPGLYRDAAGRPVRGADIVAGALEYVVDQTTSTGYITAHGSRMYSHAFATLFLAQAYGAGLGGDDGRVRAALKRAVTLIIGAQNAEGGWRYQPQAVDSDMSVTVCQVMALRAARNAGLRVPKGTIDAAVLYVRRSYLPQTGGFTYQLATGPMAHLGSRDTFPLTAAGLTTLFGAGEYASPEIQQALRYLWWRRPRPEEARGSFDYYYGQYYAIQAMFQKGGEAWRRWYESYVKPDMLALQDRREGCWTDLVGSNYATAMATIILQFPNQYLPISEN